MTAHDMFSLVDPRQAGCETVHNIIMYNDNSSML